jgi:hypothetical protein
MSVSEQYERFGTLRVIRKEDRVLIRSRYTLGALRSIWMAVGIVGLGAYAMFRNLARGRWHARTWFDSPLSEILFFGTWALLTSVWGLVYFYRRDELFIQGNEWSFSSWIPFRSTVKRDFHRDQLLRIRIDQGVEFYGLRLVLSEGDLLLYSDRDLTIVRGAADFLQPILGVPVEEKLPVGKSAS